jgi:hypothetical protein
MDRDLFWKSVHPPVCVGCEMDRDKTTTSYTDDESVLLNRLTGEGIIIRDNCNDNDVSNGSIDKTIHGDDKYFHDTNHRNLDNANSDSGVDECELTSEELATQASEALKSLGNVRRKALDQCASKDIFVLGKVILRTSLAKKHSKALKKQSRKRELIFQSMDYFQSEMAKRRQLLDESIKQSADTTFDYQQLEWKNTFKHYMRSK